jgi:hypothetical protein
VKIILYARDSSIGEVVKDGAETSEWWKKQLGKAFHFDDLVTFEARKEEPLCILHYGLTKLKRTLEGK